VAHTVRIPPQYDTPASVSLNWRKRIFDISIDSVRANSLYGQQAIRQALLDELTHKRFVFRLNEANVRVLRSIV